jgi:ABC-type sugar transport system permease subunit
MKLSKEARASWSSRIGPLLFMAPWAIGFLLFMAFPVVFSLYMSFHRVRILPTHIEATFKGLDYYREHLFGSGALYEQLIPFLREAVIMIPVIVIFALLMAILLNQRFAGRFLFRTIFFLPVIFSSGPVISELVNQGQGSLGFLEKFDIESLITLYLGDNAWTKPILNIMQRFILILWYSGVQILIFLAGRQTIPKSVYEASRIDGSSPWEGFWKITFPAMIPFVLLNTVYTVVDLFTYPFNPVIALIDKGNYGASSALAWIYFMIILAVLGITFWLFKRVTRNSAPID